MIQRFARRIFQHHYRTRLIGHIHNLVIHIFIALKLQLAVIHTHHQHCASLFRLRIKWATRWIMISCQWQRRCIQTNIIHHKVITITTRSKIVNWHTRLIISHITLYRENHLMPTFMTNDLSRTEDAHILPFLVAMITPLDIATECGVCTIIIARTRVKQPHGAVHRLAATYYSIGRDICY